MNLALALIAFLILGAAAVAMALRNLIHSALLLIAAWFGIAAFYLWAGAEFIAFAQILVYVGAISMVVLFAVLLTRRSRADLLATPDSRARVATGLYTAAIVGAVLLGAVANSSFDATAHPAPALTVRQLGVQLMGPHAAAVLVVGIILTVALLGGVVLAAAGRKEDAS